MRQHLYDDLLAICAACDDKSSRILASGARYVRNLDVEKPLAFLHCFFAPLTLPERERYEMALGCELPLEVTQFLERANGVKLFDKTINIFGYVERITRSLALEHQAPISLVSYNEEFAACYPDRWHNGWRQVGAVTGKSTRLLLQAHSTGKCAVVWEDQRSVEFASFHTMLAMLVDRIGTCFTCQGLRDPTYNELEATLEGLLVTH